MVKKNELLMILEEMRCPFFLSEQRHNLGVGTYSETEDGLSQLLELLFSLTDSHLRALLHVTDLPLRENTHKQIKKIISVLFQTHKDAQLQKYKRREECNKSAVFRFV